MASRQMYLLQNAAPVVATGVGYFVAAVTALAMTRGSDGIATMWPASGFLLAVSLLVAKDRLWLHLAAGAVGSLCANLHSDNAIMLSTGFTFANVAEAAVAYSILRRYRNIDITFTDPSSLATLFIAALIATVLSATVAVISAGTLSASFWLSWFATDLLGILVVTPLILIVSRACCVERGLATVASVSKAFLLLAIVAIATCGVFAQSSYPLLFVPMLTVLLATFRLGPLGAAGGVLVVATISTVAVGIGSGPHVMLHAGPLVRSLFLQFYLLSLFASSLPIATLLAARTKLIDQLAEQMRLLQLAEGAAHVGHWRLDLQTEAITWSREVFRIHGITGDLPPKLEVAINAYHEEDRARVSAHIEDAIRSQEGFEFSARIVRPDGEVRHVLSRGEIDRRGGPRATGVFGIIQDITAQVMHARNLEDARVVAEMAAEQAKILAETDQLTGIANRRRTSFVLDQAVADAIKTGRPVSIGLFDIDHFKRINDTFGHQTGDLVLQRVAADAASQLRSGDTLGRIGGEEFLIVLPNATAEAAMMVSERVRAAIESSIADPHVTISIGVAQLVATETSASLMRRADVALYCAKDEGRNSLRLAA